MLAANSMFIAAKDKKGRENLRKYILRQPLSNDWLKILDDGTVRLGFKRPRSDGDLAPDGYPPISTCSWRRGGRAAPIRERP